MRCLVVGVCCLAALSFGRTARAESAEPSCARTIHADVVAIDQAYQLNRLGTSRPGGLLFALRRDVEPTDGGNVLRPGKVQLKPFKRPRPMVLRVNVGDCLTIDFENLLAGQPTDSIQPATRNVSLHLAGMSLRDSIASDGTYVGQNPAGPTGLSGVVNPGGKTTYSLYASTEGAYLLYSMPGDYNNFGTQQLTMGLFGALNVEPKNSEWYRSQVTEEDLRLATRGKLPDGHPKIDYDATYPAGHPRAHWPILRILDGKNEIVHTDLTAVVTGRGRGRLDGGAGNNPVLPDRDWPFREVTVHYHESQDVVQAFAYFYNGTTSHVPTVNAGSDSFAINYGVAGIGPEVLANRIGVGPAADCPECKFEEFFLSSWAEGDPGIVVDVPANAEEPTACQLEAQFRGGTGRSCEAARKKPTRAFYPDDPSNVYHSYLGDHVRFRILHAGAAVTHVHHHHAHQWLHSGTDQDSNYLDSQSIGPGSSYTLELVYDGSGNRNLSAGDSIFHCHFYPHFASGMWALFRVHDVFEEGTPLDEAQRPRHRTRALPDPEIGAGTPIPAVVPLPTMAMAPLPSQVEIVDGQVKLGKEGFPGYPFYVPGLAGHRAPHPPLDFAVDPATSKPHDGGLPRHLITAAAVANEQHSLTDWSKDLGSITAFELPEAGTPAEQRAMKYFGLHLHPSFTPQGQRLAFKVNGLPRGPQRGAPFADPAVVDGKAVGNEVPPYHGADLQLDAVFNKAGWHYPQQRMMSLWGDVNDYLGAKRPPEPLFFRAASNDVIEYWHANLVPSYFELDDFEVRTPTDILGQHIHLVKFDVMASDGAGNGFNYEDGTFSPDEVRDRIAAINAAGGLWDFGRKNRLHLTAKAIPALGDGPGRAWVGAQATVQRWWVDPLMDSHGTDRTYMTVFTHDHFGPSTHQMIGLYGGLLVEPQGTQWTSLDGKTRFRDWQTRNDGGPTSFAANILYLDPGSASKSYREFGLEWGDLQLVYGPASKSLPDCYSYVVQGTKVSQSAHCKPVVTGASYAGWSDPLNVINCPQCQVSNGGGLAYPATPNILGQAPSPPQPFLIADFGAGMMAMNYRTEPLPLRINRPPVVNPAADPNATDLAYAFTSILRLDPAFSSQPKGGSPINPACQGADCLRFPLRPLSEGMQPADPFTPLLTAYAGDRVQMRLLVGAHTSMHDFTMHGLRWRYQPFSADSGYRNTQFAILSEHFEPIFTLPQSRAKAPADYLYNPTASYEGLTNGIWGLLRAYDPAKLLRFLAPLAGAGGGPAAPLRPPPGLPKNCDTPEPCLREFEVHAVALQGGAGGTSGGLVYNARGVNLGNGQFDASHPLYDPWALVYVLGRKRPDPSTAEPLVLRARAGDWIHVTLINDLTGKEPVFTNPAATEIANRAAQIPYANPYANVNLTTSSTVGLHPQLVEMDVTAGDGANVGGNPVETAKPGGKVEYWWYAGKIEDGKAMPAEFGAVNLLPADPLMQVYHGLFGALVIEPRGSRWTEDPLSAAHATVFSPRGPFREFVIMVQDDAAIQLNGTPLYAAGYPLSAINYRTEPAFFRFGAKENASLGLSAPLSWSSLSSTDIANATGLQMSSVDTTLTATNALVGGDPQTPILRAPAGMPVRLHLLSPGGIGDNQQSFELTGHVWQETPFQEGSTKVGFNPRSTWTALTPGLGPTTSYPLVLESSPDGSGTPAGGKFHVPGDYLYRSWTANQYQAGLWGLFRVAPWKGQGFPDTVGVGRVKASGSGGFDVQGFTTVSPESGKYAPSVTLKLGGNEGGKEVTVAISNGVWSYHGPGVPPTSLIAISPLGGVATYGASTPMSEAASAPVPSTRGRIRKIKKPRWTE